MLRRKRSRRWLRTPGPTSATRAIREDSRLDGVGNRRLSPHAPAGTSRDTRPGHRPYVLVACCRPAGFSYEDENPR